MEDVHNGDDFFFVCVYFLNDRFGNKFCLIFFLLLWNINMLQEYCHQQVEYQYAGVMSVPIFGLFAVGNRRDR